MVGKRKIAMILGMLLMGTSLIGCGNSAQNNSGETTGSTEGKKNIGIVQLVQHDALDSANKGFVDALKEKGYEDGKNITIEQQNAQGEQANAQTICSQFTDAKKDLIFAIATPTAQAAYNSTKDIPIVLAAFKAKASNSSFNLTFFIGIGLAPLDKLCFHETCIFSFSFGM